MRLRIGLILASVFAMFLIPINAVEALTISGTSGYASAPRQITQSAVPGGVSLGWVAPADTGNGITGYLIQKSTSGNSGSWVDVVTTNTNSYTVLGLSGGPFYFRIAGITSVGTGAFGYPWTKLYKTVTKTRTGTSIAYEYNASGTVNSNFSRVRYLFEDTITSSYNYADVDFYKWSQGGVVTTDISSPATVQPTISNLQVPSPAVPFIVQANVSDLTVYSSVSSTGSYSNPITNGFGIKGRVELWDVNYGTNRNGLSPQGNDTNYDYDDLPSVSGAYGSFQVHNVDLGKTVFAWNEHSGANPDIGFGDAAGIAAQPDWTFCAGAGTCPAVTSFALTIYVNSPITPGADSTPPTVLRIDSKSNAKNGDTITVRSNEVGTVYLVNQSVSVSKVDSITASASNLRNSVSVGTANSDTILTISSLSDGTYNLYAADSLNNLSTAILATIRIDNTLPTASTIAVNAAGTAILISASETITNSMQVYGWYAVNDGSSSIAVTATTFSGNTATLTLARAIVSGATVTFAYSPISGDARGRWIDTAGNEMAAITSRTITNGSGVEITVNLTAPTTVSKGSSLTLTAIVPVAGKVSFTIAGKRIPGCLGKAATGTPPITVTCTFKGPLSGRQFLTSTLVPTLNVYPTTSTTVERFFLKRSTLR